MLVQRGERFADLCGKSRATIAELARPFIRDGATVLQNTRARTPNSLFFAAANSRGGHQLPLFFWPFWDKLRVS
jgi:hypothetical protein